MNAGEPLPDATELTRAQYSGWACVRCGASLRHGGVPAGRVHGSVGVHRLDTEVFACPPGRGCATTDPQPQEGPS